MLFIIIYSIKLFVLTLNLENIIQTKTGFTQVSFKASRTNTTIFVMSIDACCIVITRVVQAVIDIDLTETSGETS